MTTTGDHAHPVVRRPGARAALENELRRIGAEPIASADDIACDGLFETDVELDDFLAFTYSTRRADVA